MVAFGKPAGHREVAPREFDVHSRCKPTREQKRKEGEKEGEEEENGTKTGGGGLDSDEAKARSKRTKEQVQAKNRDKNDTFQSDTPAGRQIFCVKVLIPIRKFKSHFFLVNPGFLFQN